MARRVVLHIGSMKSGTSFVQNVLQANKDAFAREGLLFPGRRWRDQVLAVGDVIEHGGKRQPTLAPDGRWLTMAREVAEWPDTAVISMEFLGPRKLEKIRTIVGSFPDAQVDVVLTARDLTRNIPAMWLESVQNASTLTWEAFLASVRADPPADPAGKNFWKHQGLATMASRWMRGVGADHVTLVTVPPPGSPPDLLWRRFAEAVGARADFADLTVRANPAIGLATALTLRRLNEALLVDGEKPPHYDFYVKHLLAKRGLVSRHGQEPRLGFRARWAFDRARREVAKLAEVAPRVIGDLSDLEPRAVPGVDPDEVSSDEQVAAAVAGIARLIEVAVERDRVQRQKLQRLRRQARAVEA